MSSPNRLSIPQSTAPAQIVDILEPETGLSAEKNDDSIFNGEDD